MMNSQISIQWLGHSCFRIDNGVHALVLDPYDASVGYPPLHATASKVLSSHAHGDHNNVDAIETVPVEKSEIFTFDVQTVPTFHDDAGGSRRGPNLVHVIQVFGITIAHLGDLGHLLSAEQAGQIGPVDVLLVPVGGLYTIDADQAARTAVQLQADVVIPMHYKHDFGPSVIATVEPFLEEMRDRYSIVRIGKSTLRLEEAEKGTVVVLTYPD